MNLLEYPCVLEVSEQEQGYICSEVTGSKLQAIREKSHCGTKLNLVRGNLHIF